MLFQLQDPTRLLICRQKGKSSGKWSQQYTRKTGRIQPWKEQPEKEHVSVLPCAQFHFGWNVWLSISQFQQYPSSSLGISNFFSAREAGINPPVIHPREFDSHVASALLFRTTHHHHSLILLARMNGLLRMDILVRARICLVILCLFTGYKRHISISLCIDFKLGPYSWARGWGVTLPIFFWPDHGKFKQLACPRYGEFAIKKNA